MVIVFNVELSRLDSVCLQWFVRANGLVDTSGKRLSVRACVGDVVVHSFLEQVVLPELKVAGLVPVFVNGVPELLPLVKGGSL